MNDAKCNPASKPKIVTHTSDSKNRKVTDTSNGDLQQTLLINRTFPIVTTTMYSRMDDRIATCVGTPHTIATHTMKEVMTDVAHRIARVLLTPRHVSRMGRDGTTPRETPYALSPPQDNSPVLIGGIRVSPAIGHSGSLQVLNTRQSNIYDKIRDTQK